MNVIGILGCLLGFALVIFLSFKNFSPFLASCIGAFFVIILTGAPMVETLAFTTLTTALFGLSIPPVLLVVIFCGIIAALTGGSGTGFLVSLPILAPALLAQGVDPEMIHRVGLFAGTAMSMLPYSGCILMFLPISGLKLKDIYGQVFWTMVVWGLVSTGVVILCWSLGM